jgi:putative heme-binding domain-containing protein
LFLLLGLWAVFTVQAVVSEDQLPAQAQWLTADAGNDPGPVEFLRPFTSETGLIKAVVLAAADQEATLVINGTAAGLVKGFQKALTLDVTRWIRPGTNLLTLRATNTTGPAAARVLLELVQSDGRQRWVISDGTWQAVRPGRAAAPAVARGQAGVQRWGNPFAATTSADAYNSWMLARGTPVATDPATFIIPPGFRVERLRSARPEEDSWVALAFDPQGRLTVAMERKGLLRFTLGTNQVDQVEVVEDSLQECRGLLHAYGSLYVNANNSRGFYRLQDLNGDGVYEEKKLLLSTEGGVGHGRNQIRLGPDGLIYLIQGDEVILPKTLAADSPVQQVPNDQMLPVLDPRPPAKVSRFYQVGHVLQTDKDGSFFRLVNSGLRNPMDIAFNEDGEMFTYEADMERDIGAPWYRPTRILHLVPGGDYGWRRGHGNLPPYSPDTLPAAVDIGVGSPTGIAFGTQSRFPEPYRHALFIGDWAYGRILTVQLEPKGASYTGTFAEFLSGRPLNVTDLKFGPDGALYFVTGGRGTKSGLYRVSWTGPTGDPTAPSAHPEAVAARALRRRLEAPIPNSPERQDELWANLDHPDRWIRYAARRSLELLPPEEWGPRALRETNPAVSANALLALSRLAGPGVQAAMFSRILGMPLAQMAEADQLAVLRTLSITLVRFGAPTNFPIAQLQAPLLALYPAASATLNRELSRVLTHLRAPESFDRSLPLLSQATTSDERLHYLMTLWAWREGWTLDRWRAYFTALRQAEQEQGARDYFSAVRFLRNSLTNRLSSAERLALGPLYSAPAAAPAALIAPAAPEGKAWTLADFDFTQAHPDASATRGRQVYLAAGCVQCHRAGLEGGLIGPDLTSVASRFSAQDLLDHILNPSKAVDEKYRLAVLTLKDGTTVSGTLEQDEDPVVIQPGDPGAAPLEIAKAQILERQWSDQSPMPSGLLDAFNRDQVYDLLAFLTAVKPAGP